MCNREYSLHVPLIVRAVLGFVAQFIKKVDASIEVFQLFTCKPTIGTVYVFDNALNLTITIH